MRHGQPSPPQAWAGAPSAQVGSSDRNAEDTYDTAHDQPSSAGSAAPALLPWLSQNGHSQHEHYRWRDDSGHRVGPPGGYQDAPQGIMIYPAQVAAHQAHLGQFLEGPGAPAVRPPPHLSTAPRHHSMPDRRIPDDSANGLMHAAHDLMFGPDGPARPRMFGIRSITLPSGMCGGRHVSMPGDQPVNPRHPSYPAPMATPPPHHSMHPQVQRPYHPGGHLWQPDFSVGLSGGTPPAPLSAVGDGSPGHSGAPSVHASGPSPQRGQGVGSSSPAATPAATARPGSVQQHPPASNMSSCSLRRLLEASSDAKEDVAAALQHTADGFVPGLPGLTKLVSLFTKQGKWRKALAIYDVLDCLGLQADLVICNAALGACARGADTSRLWELLSDLLDKGRVPDSITFKGAISALSKNGEWQQSLKLFLSMCEQGKVAEGATCLALIGTCAKARRWQLAEEVFLCTIARDIGIAFVDAVGPPDTASMAEADLAILRRLQAWRRGGGGPVHSGEAPLSAPASVASGPGWQPSGSESSSPVKAAQLAGAADGTGSSSHARGGPSPSATPAPAVPPGQAESGARTSGHSATSSEVDAAAATAVWRDTAAQVQAALDQATTAGAAAAEPCGPHAEWQAQGLPLYNGHTETEYLFARTCCNALLIAYKLAEPVQCQRALALLTAITQVGGVVSPDVISYNTVMEALGAAGLVHDALNLLPVLRAAHLQPSRATMTLLMSLSSRAGLHGEVAGLWADLVRSGLRPETAALNTYLSALISLGRWGEACEQYQAMLRQSHSPPPDADTFSIMLWACLEQRDPLCALRIVQDAASLSKPMRAAAVQQLIGLLHDCGMQDAASAMQRAVAV